MLHAAVFLILFCFVTLGSWQDFLRRKYETENREACNCFPVFCFINLLYLDPNFEDQGAVKVTVSLYSPKQTAGILTTDVTPSTFALARTS